MTDRDAVARRPETAYVCKQSGSHDRRKVAPSDPEGRRSNADYGQIIRVEVNEGRKEWVILEDQGPTNGRLVLRLEVVGSIPATKGSRFFFGLDCATLK
jgi:hypothetical protein